MLQIRDRGNALIDSGSTVSIVSVNDLNQTQHIIDTNTTLTDCTKTNIPVLGRIELDLDLGLKQKIKQKFIVVGVHTTMILGIDFLSTNRAIIHPKARRLTIKANHLPLLIRRSTLKHLSSVCANKTGLYIRDEVLDLKILLDTGSELSFIKHTPKSQTQTDEVIYIKTASNTELKLTASVNLEIDNSLFKREQKFFVITDLQHQAILGLDYLIENNLALDFGDFSIRHENRFAPALNLGEPLGQNDVLAAISIKELGEENKSVDNIPDSISKLLEKYPDISKKKCYNTNETHNIKMSILVTDNKEVRHKPRKVGAETYRAMKEKFTDLEKQGVIKRDSPKNTYPVVSVKKKSGGFRFCVDYSILNAKTIFEDFSIPNISTITSLIQPKHKIFSILDLKEAFFNVPLTEEAQKLSGIATPFGCFTPTRAQFGLACAPSFFCRLMSLVLDGLDNTINYIDDILIYSSSVEEHLLQLERLFQRLDKYKIRLNRSKCFFLQKEVRFLGKIISQEGIAVDKDKVFHIKQLPKPKTIKQLRSFLGMINFLRSHLPKVAAITAPLCSLLKGQKLCSRSPLKWTEGANKSFLSTLQLLDDATSLAFEAPDKGFRLYTDASKESIGAVLTQDDKPLGFYSKTLTPLKKIRSTFNRELLAIKMSLKYFKGRIMGRPIIILTDHKSIINSFYKGDGEFSPLESAWLEEIREYSPIIKHIQGKDNVIADYLSRLDLDKNDKTNFTESLLGKDGEGSCLNIKSRPILKSDHSPREDPSFTSSKASVSAVISNTTELKKHTEPSRTACIECTENITYESLFRAQQGAEIEQTEDPSVTWVTEIKNDFEILGVVPKDTENLLHFRPYIPYSLRSSIFKLFHTTNHPSAKVTKDLIEASYYWPKLKTDVEHWASHCFQCQQSKVGRHNKTRLKNFNPVKGRLVNWHADLFGPLPSEAGYNYILNLKDRNTNFLVSIPLRNKKSITVVDKIEKNIIAIFGIPSSICTDRGGEFASIVFQAMCDKWDINHKMTSPYHPQCNGRIERVHRTLRVFIKSLANPRDWPQHLYLFTLTANSLPPDNNIFSPIQMALGMPGRLPGMLKDEGPTPLFDLNHVNLFMESLNEMIYIPRPLPKNASYIERDLFTLPSVWVRDEENSKIKPKFTGPYEVLYRNEKNLVIKRNNLPQTVSVDRVKGHRFCSDEQCVEACLLFNLLGLFNFSLMRLLLDLLLAMFKCSNSPYYGLVASSAIMHPTSTTSFIYSASPAVNGRVPEVVQTEDLAMQILSPSVVQVMCASVSSPGGSFFFFNNFFYEQTCRVACATFVRVLVYTATILVRCLNSNCSY